MAAYRGRSTWTLEDMGTRRQQAGFWYLPGAALSVLCALDVAYSIPRLVRSLRRRRDSGEANSGSIESMPSYLGRLCRAAAPRLFVYGTLALTFWAIVHFGPLKPVHEWFP